MRNRQWQLTRRPESEPSAQDFHFAMYELPRMSEANDVLVRNRYLSLDPYMRWRMNNVKSYAKPVEIGEVMVGTTIGEVVQPKQRW